MEEAQLKERSSKRATAQRLAPSAKLSAPPAGPQADMCRGIKLFLISGLSNNFIPLSMINDDVI
jgi:hypothetical protein